MGDVDYSDPDNWLSLPEPVLPADTFYLYPTVYMDWSDGAPGISPIDGPMMRAGAAAKMLDQASAYAKATNVFAPFYRQSNLAAVEDMSAEELYAFQHGVQRDDVFAALDHYFGHLNGGRPFVLAGHSQGSIMTEIVLEEYMPSHPEVYSRMVAAYVIGFSVTDDYLGRNPHLRFAEGADDTGVIVSWNTEGPENSGHHNIVVLDDAHCINPLSWRIDDVRVPAEGNGTVSRLRTEDGGFLEIENYADACLDLDRGVVVCTTAGDRYISMDDTPAFGPASLHNLDYGLYYGSLSQNVADRVSAFLRGQ